MSELLWALPKHGAYETPNCKNPFGYRERAKVIDDTRESVVIVKMHDGRECWLLRDHVVLALS